MARKFLDYTGVSYLWQKIVAELNKKANNQDLATVATSGSYNDLINKPAIPMKVSDLQDDSGHYIKPVGGIPAQDLAETYLTQHQDISGKVNSADLATVATSGSYNDLLNKPFIPSAVSDLTDDSGHYTKPVGGIPAADLAETYLTTETDPTVPSWAKAAQKPTYTAAEVGAPTVSEMNSAIGTAIGNVHQFEVQVVQELPAQNIQEHTVYFVPKTGETNDVYDEYIYVNNGWEMIGNTQIDLSNYVQKTDYASHTTAGIVIVDDTKGIYIDPTTHKIELEAARTDHIKAGTQAYKPITPARQQDAVFYGLATAAGDTTQKSSSNAVGTYTTEAKAAIRSMLGAAASADIPTNVSELTNDSGYITDISGKADKADTVLETTLSKGRKAGTTVGVGSFAFGIDVIADGQLSHAEGLNTQSSGVLSFTEGYNTKAIGTYSHVQGIHNWIDSVYPNATDGETYQVGDKVAYNNMFYECINAHTQDSGFVSANWKRILFNSNNAHIIGNGNPLGGTRSNAYALDWDGNGHYMSNVYVGCNADSTGGTRLATITEVAAKLDATEAGLKVVRLI